MTGKLIANVPVRNEAWILPTFLSALEKLVDVIILADQSSTDQSVAIARQFSKVEVVANDSSSLDEGFRFQLLLDAARQHAGNNFLIFLDADEILSGDVLGQASLQRVAERLRPGESAELQWIWLWKDPLAYRFDGPRFRENWRSFAFHDDRQLHFDAGLIHRHRVPDQVASNAVRFEQPKVLHYQFAYWDRALAKQRWYRCLERVAFQLKEAWEINATYAWFLGRSLRPDVRPLPLNWVDPWRGVGVEPTAIRQEGLFWFDVEVLRLFARYGAQFFADLDIWDVDWEPRRLAAIAAGCDGIPLARISDPRTPEQRFAQAFTRGTQLPPPWRTLDWVPTAIARRLRPQ